MTERTLPLIFRWNGTGMIPLSPARADAQYLHGETYRLAEYEERSTKSHNHFFACVYAAWQSLPETAAAQFPTDEHLRKWALLKLGYYDVTHIQTNNTLEVITSMRESNAFDLIIEGEGGIVSCYKAKSQSAKAMGKEEFQESKTAVLDFVAHMVGISSEELQRNAGPPPPEDDDLLEIPAHLRRAQA